MADIPLYDSPDDMPPPLARDEMHFEDVRITPYADGRRVKLTFKFPPFLDRPNVEARVTNGLGQTVATMSLIEAMDQEFEFTLHLRGPEPKGEHLLHLALFYLASDDRPDDKHIVDERAVAFTVESPYA